MLQEIFQSNDLTARTHTPKKYLIVSEARCSLLLSLHVGAWVTNHVVNLRISLPPPNTSSSSSYVVSQRNINKSVEKPTKMSGEKSKKWKRA